jgi:hypothetical protein
MTYRAGSSAEQPGILEDLAVREGDERLQLALRAARMVAWEWDPAADRIATIGDLKGIYGIESLPQPKAGFALLHPDDRQRRKVLVSAALEQGTGYRSEFRVVRPDTGETVWVEERAAVVRDEAGRLVKMTGVVMDVTDRHDAEQELRAANAELEEANAQLEEQTRELEEVNEQLQEQTAELEQQAEELQATSTALEERTDEAERAAAALRASEAQFRTLADAIPQIGRAHV